MDDYGIYVQPINYPTVPRGTERLRFTPNPAHTENDIKSMVSALSEIWTQLGLKRTITSVDKVKAKKNQREAHVA